MSLSLFTVIQAQDSHLARAVQGLEQMTGSTRLNVMAGYEPSEPETSTHPDDPLARQQNLPLRPRRPDTPRHSSAPDVRPQRPVLSPYTYNPDTVAAPYAHTLVHAQRPRNRSPYSRSHLRSRSVNTPPTSQPMLRTHSSPTPTTSSNSLSPNMAAVSPLLRQPARPTSPLRPVSPHDHMFGPPSPSAYDAGFETICEHSELDLSRSSFDRNISSLISSRPTSSRRSRQPSPSRSPLPSPSTPSARFTEAFPPLHHSTSASSFASWSSMPSTPSTNRSRSPSISSLETIEDAPDAEWEALEADRLARLKIVEEEAEESDSEPPRRASLDLPSRVVGLPRTATSARKRWSVCGAERRADLDLETIWED